ncbi:MAG TPA: carboxypeptidase M32, partial [Euryarchaeota archaeon]|nr:carboxypeptidase M32 [Euryarchaeota archaeon]
MNERLASLNDLYREISAIGHAQSVLYWDQAVNMPSQGSEGRGNSLGVLSRIAHEKRIDQRIGDLLKELESLEDKEDIHSESAGMVRTARIDYERSAKVPPDFSQRFSKHLANVNPKWVEARKKDDFSIVSPLLTKTLDFSKEYSHYFEPYDHIGDPHIDRMDYGMKADTIRALFDRLREGLVPLVKSISSCEEIDDSCLRKHYPPSNQVLFSNEVIKDFGYDFSRGRQDNSPHPFTIGMGWGDVRITVRTKEDYLAEEMFSAFHEAGHAIYEQGLKKEWDGIPLGRSVSYGVHESQSRLWENIIGRSYGFWENYYPILQAVFPRQLENVDLDTYYRAINRVKPGLIRTDADEVTYNLHVMIRFDMEMDMLEGKLSVEDLPEAWHRRYESDLGLKAASDADGCLQDIHWFHSMIGGQFQCYTLGNIMASQFYEKAVSDHPEIPQHTARGEFSILLAWLRKNIHEPSSLY